MIGRRESAGGDSGSSGRDSLQGKAPAQRRSGRSRRQRIAAGAVLASTTLLGTYLAAIRPQPTYASPNRPDKAQEPESGPAFARNFLSPRAATPECDASGVTVVDDSTALQNAIRNSVDDSVICVKGVIPLTQPLPSIDDTRLTLRGYSGNPLDDSIVVNADDSRAVSSVITGTFTTSDDT